MFLRRRRLRVAGVAAVAATALLAAGCGSSTSSTSTTGAALKGGIATVPNIDGAGANQIFPFSSSQFYSVTNYEGFMYLMERPLYMFGNEGQSIAVNYALSPADAPVYSNGGKTVVINLKGWKWSNGETVDANDLMFFLNMLEAEKANYAGYTPGLFPDNMSSYKETGPNQVTLQLKTGYSNIWFTYNQLAILFTMPNAWDVTSLGASPGSGGCLTDSAADGWAKCKAVYNFLTAQAKNTSTYATSPLWSVVDGPWKLSYFNIDGNYDFVPNKSYSGPQKPILSELKFVAYTSDTAIYTALRTGVLDTGGIPTTDLPLKPISSALPATNPLASSGYYLQPAYSFGIGYAYDNFNNPVYGPVFKQLYFRQALQYLNNQAGMSESIGRGYAIPTTSGVPNQPISQWISSDMTENSDVGPYAYNPAKAEALLAAHGWKNVGGVLTCESSTLCGAGIKVGLQAKFTMLYTSGISTQADDVDILKSGWGLAHIQLTAEPETFDTLLGDTVPCSGAKCTWTFLYLGGWDFNGPGFEPTGEPLFESGVPNNSGGYSDAEMNTLITATHTSNSLSVFDTYANYTATQLPALWLPFGEAVVAVKNNLHGVAQNPLGMFLPEYWYFTK